MMKKIFLPDIDVSFQLNGEWSDVPAMSAQASGSLAFSTKKRNYFTLISIYTIPQDNAMQFNQDDKTIAKIHEKEYDDKSGLIELQSLTTSHGVNMVYRLTKRLTSDNIGNNMSYILTIDVYGSSKNICRIQAMTASGDLFDVRNSAVRQQFMEDKGISLVSDNTTGWSYDPYDSSFNKGILMNLSERREYDKLFPNHPLSVTRRILEEITETICFNQPARLH